MIIYYIFFTRNGINATEYRIDPLVQFVSLADYVVNYCIHYMAEKGNSAAPTCDTVKMFFKGRRCLMLVLKPYANRSTRRYACFEHLRGFRLSYLTASCYASMYLETVIMVERMD